MKITACMKITSAEAKYEWVPLTFLQLIIYGIKYYMPPLSITQTISSYQTTRQFKIGQRNSNLNISVFDDFLSQRQYICYSFWRCLLSQTSKYIYLLKFICHKSLDLVYWAKWNFCFSSLPHSSTIAQKYLF